jgi:EAL and modified HD-GYP domain-containing signal transduction protein
LARFFLSNDVVFVSRQPIFGRSLDLFGYELLYRSDVLDDVLVKRGDKGQAFLNTFADLGLESDRRAFINVSRVFILQDYCKALPADAVVLEISRSVRPDESVIRSLTDLSKSGYKLALDDFDFTECGGPMLDIANYVNVNFDSPPEAISKQLSMVHQSKAKAIAKRVETHEAFEIAKSMGFEYFRGSCLIEPNLSPTSHVSINRLSTLQLVIKLQEPELQTSELEKIVSQDLAISYRLLHYVNSAALSLPKQIESIRTAIQMVGMEHLRSWASLLFLSKLDDKPAELIITAFVRAKMAECLAAAMGAENSETYYMVGLFSLVGALLNVTMKEAIQLLPFSKEVANALLSHEGPMGHVLRCVLAYETADWNNVVCGGVDAATIRQCYIDAIAAAQRMPGIARST